MGPWSFSQHSPFRKHTGTHTAWCTHTTQCAHTHTHTHIHTQGPVLPAFPLQDTHTYTHTPVYTYTPVCTHTHTLPALSLREALLFNHFPSRERVACGALPAGADVRPAEGTARLGPPHSFAAPPGPAARTSAPPAASQRPAAAALLPTCPGRGLLGSLGIGDQMPTISLKLPAPTAVGSVTH